MFINEPEGNSFSDLNQYLAVAVAHGTAIDIKTSKGKIVKGFINHSQKSLPDYLEVFTSTKDGVGKNITKISVNDITWFKLRRHGLGESFIGKDGVPMAKMPIIVLASKKINAGGKIINPGVTSIHGEEVDVSGEITSDGKEAKSE